MIKDFIKKLINLSPIPLTKNHKYDILTKRIINRLPQSSNCIDVGCFKGEILDLMKNAAPKGQHFGIEPIPSQFDYLSQKYMNTKNCKVFNIAASNATGVSEFNFVQSNPSYSGLRKRDYDKPNEIDTTIKVKTDLLDNVIPSDVSIALIKIDVEGAELLVLEGASKIIEKYKPIVVFEHGMGASNHYGTSPAMIFDYFHNKSMRLSTLDNYLSKKNTLTKVEFEKQYYDKVNYYFIAHK